VTKSISGIVEVGDSVYFDANDSGMPGGTGDTFLFELFIPGRNPTLCFTPAVGHPITNGNVVIKTTMP
jgi:hypothetical protein